MTEAPEKTPSADTWRSVEIFLPSTLSRDEVTSELRSGVMRFATDGGDFVRRIRINEFTNHPGGWRKWSAAYLAGPPGAYLG